MKIYKNGKEVTATVEYGADNKPAFVTESGVRQKASAFTFEEDAPKTKKKVTRKAPATKKK